MNIRAITKGVALGLQKRSPQLLMAGGTIGVGLTVASAIRDTQKFTETMQTEYPGQKLRELPKDEAVLLIVKHYWRTALLSGLTVASFMMANRITANRLAVAVGAYSLADKEFREFKTKVKETLGEEQNERLQDKLDRDVLRENPIQGGLITQTTGGGELFYDRFSGRYFLASVNHVREAQNRANQTLYLGSALTLNEFYLYLGLDTIELGDELYWESGELIEITIGTQSTTDNRPCFVVGFETNPHIRSY